MLLCFYRLDIDSESRLLLKSVSTENLDPLINNDAPEDWEDDPSIDPDEDYMFGRRATLRESSKFYKAIK